MCSDCENASSSQHRKPYRLVRAGVTGESVTALGVGVVSWRDELACGLFRYVPYQLTQA